MSKLNLEHSLVDDRYEVVSRLSLGSYAEIYTARDRMHEGRMVILKALNTTLQGDIDDDLTRTLIENFENEAKAVDRVCHPNIVRRLGHGTAVDLAATTFHYLIFEYMAGGDMRHKCQDQPLSIEKLLYFLNQVCSALTHAHQCGVIHRDIKPHNLLLTADENTVKIADFGVAKITGQGNDEITRVGTDVYAPPEHHPLSIESGTGILLTPSADVYSLAKTVYALLTGSSPKRFSLRAITELPPEISYKPWSDNLLSILNRATKTDIGSRYQSVHEFWTDLQTLTDFDEVDATKVRPRLEFDTVPPTPAKPSFTRPAADHRPIVVAVPHRPKVEQTSNSSIHATAAQTPVINNKSNGTNRVDVSIHPRQPLVSPNDRSTAASQKPAVASKSQTSLNRWQRADILLSRHRKIILTIIGLGLLVVVLGIVYYSFRGATLHFMGQSIGDNANAVVARPVTLRDAATPAASELGYLLAGAKLHVIRAIGEDEDDWSKDWLEVEVVDWATEQPTARATHGYVYGPFVKSTDGRH